MRFARPTPRARRSPRGLTLVALILVLALSSVVVLPGQCPAVRSASARSLPASPQAAFVDYSVTFISGLPQGTSWGVTVLGRIWTTTNQSIVLIEPNGSYTYSAYATTASGSTQTSRSYANGSFVVTGKAITIDLFSLWHGPGAPMPAPTAAGSSVSTLLPLALLTGVAVALLAIATGLAFVVRRRGTSRAPASEHAEERTGYPPAAEGPPAVEAEYADPLRHML